MSNFDVTTDHKAAIRRACNSDWSLSYPEWVREAFVRGLKTDVLPPYAIDTLSNAIRVAVAINERLEKQARLAEQKQQQSASTGHNKSAQRKAAKRARDREIRQRMKSPKGSK